MLKKKKFLLLLIFLFVLSTRLFFVFSSDNFTGHNAYDALAKIDAIDEGNLFDYYHFSSFSLFHYILAFFNLFLPLSFVGKFFPQLFASSLVLIVYHISLRITNNWRLSLITSLIAGFIPIFFKLTINTISPHSLSVPLIFLSLFFLLNISGGKKNVYFFLISLSLLLLTHVLSAVLIFSLLFYLILVKAINFKDDPLELELILFSSFISSWFLLLMFKKAFFAHGYYTIWQNAPLKILSDYFFDIGILEVIYAIGIIPFVFGIYVIYSYLFKRKKKSVYIFSSVVLVSNFSLWFKLIKPSDALILIGLSLVILSTQFFKDFLSFLSKSKISYKKLYLSFLVLFLFFSSFLPSLSYAKQQIDSSLSDGELDALVWLRNNVPKNSLVVSVYSEGKLLDSISGVKSFISEDFLLVDNIDQRFEDHETIFNSVLSSNPIRLLTKYGIEYIYFSPMAANFFDIDKVAYIDDSCFSLVFDGDVKIYEVGCVL